MDCSKNSFFRTGNNYIQYFRQGYLLPLRVNDGVLKKLVFPTSDFKVIIVFMLNYRKMSKILSCRVQFSLKEEINEENI